MVEKLSNIGNQLQYVIDMVERKTAKKDGSHASVGDFRKFFSFSKFPAATWLTDPANTAFRHSASNLIRSHQLAMKNKLDAGLVKEVEHVQGESKALLQQLMDLYFPDQYVEIIPERPYSCKITNRALESIRYSGKTDAVIKSTEYDIAALCWEIKNQLIVLEGGGEIAQTAAQMAGELDAMFDSFDFKPPRYAAVLTNGVAFLFVMATLVNGKYSWRHSSSVTDAETAAKMIEGSLAVAAELLQLFNKLFNVPIERLKLDDDHGDHTESDEAGDGAKSGSIGQSLGGTDRVPRRVVIGGASSGTKTTTGGANATKKGTGTKKSGDSQDYRFASLTIPNVEMFNRTRGGIFSF